MSVSQTAPSSDELEQLDERLRTLKESYERFVIEWDRISREARGVQKQVSQHIDTEKLDAISKHIQSL